MMSPDPTWVVTKSTEDALSESFNILMAVIKNEETPTPKIPNNTRRLCLWKRISSFFKGSGKNRFKIDACQCCWWTKKKTLEMATNLPQTFSALPWFQTCWIFYSVLLKSVHISYFLSNSTERLAFTCPPVFHFSDPFSWTRIFWERLNDETVSWAVSTPPR